MIFFIGSFPSSERFQDMAAKPIVLLILTAHEQIFSTRVRSFTMISAHIHMALKYPSLSFHLTSYFFTQDIKKVRPWVTGPSHRFLGASWVTAEEASCI